MKKNKILAIILAASLLPFSALPVSAADINVLINGNVVEFTSESGKPFVDENSRTLVPLRVTMEAAGAAVGYDSDKKTAVVVTLHSRIEVPVGQNYFYDNNNKIANDTTAVIKDGRVYLPIRAVLEASEFTVEWDNKTKTVNAYNVDYNNTDFVPYDAGDLGTLLRAILDGNVVYINGSYYSTPEYFRMVDKIEYTNEDLNKAIYPQRSRYAAADLILP
jgi:hypothetical protein